MAKPHLPPTCLIFLFVGFSVCCEKVEANTFTEHQLDKLYCGRNNCYNILEVDRTATKQEISKSYRNLARKIHPDRNPSAEAKAHFHLLSQAHNVLTDDSIREAYDYYLDHPNDVISLLYGIRAVYPAQTSPALVLAVIMLFVSFVQVVHFQTKYHTSRSGIMRTVPFQKMVKQELDNEFGSKFKRFSEAQKAACREEVESRLLDDYVEIDGVKLTKLKWKDLLLVQLILLPLTILKYVYWRISWIYKFIILQQPLGDAEREYLTKKQLNCSDLIWANMEEESKKKLVAAELWIPENWKVYEAELEETQRAAMINSAKFRQFQRWKKKNQA